MYLKLVLIVCIIGGSWAACPPADDVAPCTCNEEKLQFRCGTATSDGNSEWDIKAYFDRVTPLISPDVIFDYILITGTNLVRVSAEAIKTLKFNKVYIEANHRLEYIHPDAFGDTVNVTTYLSIISNNMLTNEGAGHSERDLFDVITKFKAATEILIHHNRIRSIPDGGFGPLPNLRKFRLGSGVINRIGSRAFSQLPDLESANLNSCEVSIDEIADDAFEGVGTSANILLEHNPISRLPEVPFKNLLDSGSVAIGGQNCYFLCADIELDCDVESAWLCQDVEKYTYKVKGFYCKSTSGYKTIWDYCAGEVNNK